MVIPVTVWKLQVTGCELKAWKYEVKFKSTSPNSRVTSGNLQVTSTNPRVTSSNSRVHESLIQCKQWRNSDFLKSCCGGCGIWGTSRLPCVELKFSSP